MEKSSAIKAQAQKHLSSGHLDKAISEYEKLLALEDIDPYDYVLVGDVHLKNGSSERAVSLYLRSIDSYEKLGLYKNAVAIGSKILRLNPSMSDVHRRLGDIRLRAGLVSEAVRDYVKYHDMKLKEGDKEAAVEALELARKASPEDTSLSDKLVILYDQTNRIREAAVELMRASQVLRARGQESLAAQYSERALSLDPEAARGAATGAETPLDAAAQSEQASGETSEDSPAEQQDFVAATPAMELARQHDASREPEPPDTPEPPQTPQIPEPATSAATEAPAEALRQRAYSRPTTVNISHVLKQFKAQMEDTLNPEDHQAHYDLGVTYKEMGLHEEALNEFRVAAAGQDYRAKAFEMAGLCHLEMGEFEESIEAFRRALRERNREDEDYPGLCFNIARALEGAGSNEEAVEYLREVSSLNPDFPGLQEKLQALTDTEEEAEL